MTYVAIGVESKKIYAEAETKNECWKLLLQKYPEGRRYKSKKIGSKIAHIYPEPLFIKRRR